MNRTFKVVFNKARGALMVANEMTSSVQKKGVKTVVAVAAAAACGASIAAGTGISNTTVSFDENTTITTDANAGEGNYRFSGIAATNGTTSVTISEGKKLTINGTLEQISNADRIPNSHHFCTRKIVLGRNI